MRLRVDRGASLVEWGATLLVIAGILVALLASELPSTVSVGVRSGVCEVFQGDDCERFGAGGAEAKGKQPGGPGQNGQPGQPGQNGQQGPGQNGQPPNADLTPEQLAEQIRQADGDIDQAEEEARQADAEATSKENQAGSAGDIALDAAKEISGIADAERCIGDGDLASCGWTALTFVPFVGWAGKAVKAGKAIQRVKKLKRAYELAKGAATAARRRAAAARARVAASRSRAAQLRQQLLKKCGGNSFAAGTLVLLAGGRYKRIEDVDIGDLVWASDPRTGRAGSYPVTDVIRGQGVKQLVDVTVDADGLLGRPATRLTATDGHPFWVAGRGAWVEAGQLGAGDRLPTAGGRLPAAAGAGGEVAPAVTATRTYARTQRVYNLTVAGLHTYYVAAGGRAVLVHNGSRAQPACASAFPRSVITQGGLDHSFDRHAAQWFGREVPKSAKMAEWQALIERASQSTKVVPWRSGGTQTYGKLARIDGKNFFVQFDRTTGELVTAFVPTQRDMRAITKLLGQ